MINLTIPILSSCLVLGLIVGLYIGFRLTSRLHRKDAIENQILRSENKKLLERTDELLEFVDRLIGIGEKDGEHLKKIAGELELISFYLKETKDSKTKVNRSGKRSKE